MYPKLVIIHDEFYRLQAVPKNKHICVLAELAWKRNFLMKAAMLKHALAHKCGELQSRSREDQSTKSSLEIFLMQPLSHILLHWKRALMGSSNSRAPSCTLRQKHHPHS